MSRALLLIGALALAGCDGGALSHDAILGTWKSNERLTLQSLSQTGSISPQSRAFLADDFFGHQIVEISENESRTTHAKDNYDSGSEPYEVLEVSDDFVRIKAWSNFFQDYHVRTLYLEGDCYYEIFTTFGFRTYFCKHG